MRRSRWSASGSLLLGLAVLAGVKAVLLTVSPGPPSPAGERAPQVPPALLDHDLASDPGALPEPAAGPMDEGRHAPADGVPAGAPDQMPRAPVRVLSPGELEVLEELAARRRAIEEREEALDLRRSLIETAETRLQDRLEELERLKAEIEAMVEEHEAGEDEKLARLVKIYETMKAKAAAEIFNRLEMDVLLAVVGRMREAKSSEILGRMDPVRAKELTAELARRRQLPIALP